MKIGCAVFSQGDDLVQKLTNNPNVNRDYHGEVLFNFYEKSNFQKMLQSKKWS